MRVAIVAHAFPPYVGGLSYVIENLSINLVKKGIEVEVVTLDPSERLPREENYKSVIVKRFRGYAPSQAYFIASMECVNYLKKIDADVVHIHNVGSVLTLQALMTIRRRGGKPLVVISPHHHEGGSRWHTKIAWLFYKPLIRRALKRADRVHAVSDYEASLIRRDFHVEPIVIPNGVSEDVLSYRWDPPRDRVVATYAGRVERYKRVDLAVKVLKGFQERIGRKAILRVIGEGGDLPRVLGVARRSGVEVEWHRFLPRERYLKLLSQSTVFINLSKYEAYSIVTAEALAIGVPAIIAEPWGNTFKHEEGVYIVEAEDLSTTVETLKKIANLDTNSLKPLKRISRSLTWSQVTEHIVSKLYTP